MFDAKVVQVIETDLDLRGEGKAPNDPYRRIRQFWTMGGELLFEFDPLTGGKAGPALERGRMDLAREGA